MTRNSLLGSRLTAAALGVATAGTGTASREFGKNEANELILLRVPELLRAR